MKIKIAYLFAASVLLCAGYASPGAQAQQPAPDFASKTTGTDEGAARESKRQRMLDKFDLNHDGTLDESEREKMRAVREEKLKQVGMEGGRRAGGRRKGLEGAGAMGGPPGDTGNQDGGSGSGPGGLGRAVGPGGVGTDGADGMRQAMTDEQRQARRKRLLDRFDANHDGKLDESERMQIREKMGKMGGGGGGGRRHRRGNWAGGGISGGAPGGSAAGGAPGSPGAAPGGAAPGGAPN